MKKVLCTVFLSLSGISYQAYALDNGVYTITSKVSGKYLETTSALTTDGANVAVWSSTGNDTQKWLVTNQGNDQYSLINLNSGKALEVYEYSTQNGGNVEQWEYSGGTTQLWTIKTNGNYVSFINVNSGKALDLYNFDTSNGANVEQWTYTGNDAQLWSLTKTKNVESTPYDPSETGGAEDHWNLSGSLVTHDPTLAYEDGTWWVFQTGDGIAGKYSTNALTWQDAQSIFPNGLSWWQNYVPKNDGLDVWAPDLRFYNGRAWMYYAISSFGDNTSAIGLTSASSIATGDWEDDGLVINTTASDDYNAIDPDLVVAKDGAPWLVFGSWFSGIKLTRINPETMKPFGPIYSLAARSGGIEAPTIIYRQGYYYLFVSIGKCCSGVDSTYRIAYGRSTSITGPYVSKSGLNMTDGHVSILDSGNSQWVGPGGQDILNTDVIVRHAYDATDNGTSKLLISKLNWDSDGWPKY